MIAKALRAAALAVLATCAVAAAPRPTPPGEAATAAYFASIRNNPMLLVAFLAEMPKGGDLHNHLSGAIYAESYLRWAAEDGLCVVTASLSIVAGPCDPAARPSAADVVRNSDLYSRTIDAMSMRNWDASLNGHDHFFATFGRMGPSSGRTGDMLAEVTARAAAERVSYLELMVTVDGGAGAARGMTAGWDSDLARLRDKLLAAGFRDAVLSAARTRLDQAEARERELLKCGSNLPDPGCRVTVRYLHQVARAGVAQLVFAQMLAGFEIAAADPRVVGLNLVQPEDDPVAVREFSLQMSMLEFLHAQYPAVKIALHAGELTAGLVPPETLRFHIRESVRAGHALRIGHGVDVMYEDDPIALLREMAAKEVLVEIALSSNDLILGVKGSQHPLRAYLRYGVPVALVTDDPGVSRSTLTQEYRKAVEQQGIDYRALKRMARNSIDHCFADAATKVRLQADLDAAFRAFEARRRVP